MEITQMRALYRKATPKKKGLVTKAIGNFFEEVGIRNYLEWREEEFGERIVNESRVDPLDEYEYIGKKDLLPYDYYFEVLRKDNRVDKYYLECKAKLLGTRNDTFEIQSAKINNFKKIQKRGTIIYLLCNLSNGFIFSVFHNSSCVKIHPSGEATINTNYCGNKLGQDYAVSPIDLNDLMDEMVVILDRKQLRFEFGHDDR